MIAGFCFLVKTPFYPSVRIKKERNSVSKIMEILTHRIIHINLIINLFND